MGGTSYDMGWRNGFPPAPLRRAGGTTLPSRAPRPRPRQGASRSRPWFPPARPGRGEGLRTSTSAGRFNGRGGESTPPPRASMDFPPATLWALLVWSGAALTACGVRRGRGARQLVASFPPGGHKRQGKAPPRPPRPLPGSPRALGALALPGAAFSLAERVSMAGDSPLMGRGNEGNGRHLSFVFQKTNERSPSCLCH